MTPRLPDARQQRAGMPGSRLARWTTRIDAKRRSPLPPLRPNSIPLVHHSFTKEAPMTNITPLHSPQAGEINEEQMSDLRERVRVIAESDKTLSQARIAKEADVSSATLSQFLGGTYAGNMQKVAQRVQSWLQAYDEKQSSGGLPAGPEWVETPTSQRILGSLRYAQLAADIVLVVGGAGVGKTRTIARYATTAPNVWVVELSAATGSLINALEEIAIAVGLRDYSRSAGYLQRAIAARVRGTGGLLIIDEAQHCTVQALDGIRWFNDKCDIGVVFSGNERVYTQMTGGNRAAYLDRLYSRVGKKIHIKRSTQGDADSIIAAWGIDDMKCRERIRDIAAKPGALRVLNKVLRLAATYAKASGRGICCDDILASARELGVFE